MRDGSKTSEIVMIAMVSIIVGYIAWIVAGGLIALGLAALAYILLSSQTVQARADRKLGAEEGVSDDDSAGRRAAMKC
jgi:hypothetical protein